MAAWRAVSANLAGSVSSPRRTAAASAPASTATRSASSSSGARPGVSTRHGQPAAPGADGSPAPRIRGSTPARSSDDLPAPDTPDTTIRPAPGKAATSVPALRWRPLRGRRKGRVLLLKRVQPPIGGIDHSRDTHQRWRRHPIGPGQPVIGIDDLSVTLTDLDTHAAPGINGIPAAHPGLRLEGTCVVFS